MSAPGLLSAQFDRMKRIVAVRAGSYARRQGWRLVTMTLGDGIDNRNAVP